MPRPYRPGHPKAGLGRRLEQYEIGRRNGIRLLCDDGGVAQPLDHVPEELTELAVGLEYENSCHSTILGTPGVDFGCIWYENGMSPARILVIDDDADIRSLVRELLERVGYLVEEAPDGKAGLRALYNNPPDGIVLDVTMPELDGWATLERIRDVTRVPVLMLTARGTELERVRGLKQGADDYVVKRFGRQELVARVEALLRRAGRNEDVPDTYADSLLTVDFGQRLVSIGDREVQLTPLEFKLLGAFVRHPNQVLSRDQLLELVWGGTYGVSPAQVKLYVGYLRAKLKANGSVTSPIETVRGFGYRYRPDAASSVGT